MKNIRKIGNLINQIDLLKTELARRAYLTSDRTDKEAQELEAKLMDLDCKLTSIEFQLIEFLGKKE